jgi:hypothetical protein
VSRWGGDLDALLALAQAAVPSLVGADHVERGIRLAKDLRPQDLPHLFAYEPRDASEALPHHRKRTSTVYSLLLVTRDATQEATALLADAIEDAIDADSTLGGRVLSCRVSDRTLREHPAVADRGVGFLVTVTREA